MNEGIKPLNSALITKVIRIFTGENENKKIYKFFGEYLERIQHDNISLPISNYLVPNHNF